MSEDSSWCRGPSKRQPWRLKQASDRLRMWSAGTVGPADSRRRDPVAGRGGSAQRGLAPRGQTVPKTNKDGKLEACKPIQKVEWKASRASGEAYLIFSGGLPYDKAGRAPSITVMHGKTTTVLEMEHNVVDFITLCESPWVS
ncbi:hypothetical protein B566_EDAN010336, partial [Ephemera danica]